MIPDQAIARANALLSHGGRRILGIAGLPGAGKSTLAAQLAEQLGASAMVVPMDGFHLAKAEPRRLGRAERKGAPDTFDAAGYVALLGRIRQQRPGEVIYAPAFHREIEEPIAGEIPIPHDVPLIITEGNYLLMEDGAWAGVRAQLDEAWFVDVDAQQQYGQLLARHMRYGRSQAQAEAWIAQTDAPNAQRIAATAHRADYRVAWASQTMG